MTCAAIPQRPAAMFISHGGGPLPVLGDPGHREMVAHLREIAATIEKPSAIVVISAHWEAPELTVTAHPKPPLIYDYYGFPAESYSLANPAPGVRYCHPRKEHLLPLHVCYGVARTACTGHAELTIMGKKSSPFFW